MTADEKNAYITKYISNLMGKLKENGINFTEEQKREKTKTNEYKQAQSKAETQRAIDKHQSKVEAKELKELKKEYKQMQKEPSSRQ